MTVKNIFDFLNEKFPVNTACDFDNVGILVGNPDSEVNKVMIALDCTPIVINSALENGCELIITHHPVIFEPLKNVLADSVVYKLIKNNLSVISMHTNLDIGDGGVNDCLASVLSLGNIQKITTHDGYLLTKGTLSPVSSSELAEMLKQKLGGGVKYIGSDRKIVSVLICSGSGGGYISEAVKHGYDALITADVKHNHFIEADFNGVALFDAGHFETEDVVINPLKELLSKKFKTVSFLTEHSSKIKYI